MCIEACQKRGNHPAEDTTAVKEQFEKDVENSVQHRKATCLGLIILVFGGLNVRLGHVT